MARQSISNRIVTFFKLIIQLIITIYLIWGIVILSPYALALLPLGLAGYISMFIMVIFIARMSGLIKTSKNVVKNSFGNWKGPFSFLFN